MKRHDKNNQIVSGLRVEVRNDDINGALRKFKKKVQDSGILQELREREEYTKPSIKRKKAKAAARARWLKQVSRMELDPVKAKRRK